MSNFDSKEYAPDQEREKDKRDENRETCQGKHIHRTCRYESLGRSPKRAATTVRDLLSKQNGFIDYHHNLLFLDDLTDFNLELLRYLAWYNLERPYFSPTTPIPARKTADLLSPVQFLHHNHQCNRYWPDTAT